MPYGLNVHNCVTKRNTVRETCLHATLAPNTCHESLRFNCLFRPETIFTGDANDVCRPVVVQSNKCMLKFGLQCLPARDGKVMYISEMLIQIILYNCMAAWSSGMVRALRYEPGSLSLNPGPRLTLAVGIEPFLGMPFTNPHWPTWRGMVKEHHDQYGMGRPSSSGGLTKGHCFVTKKGASNNFNSSDCTKNYGVYIANMISYTTCV